MDRDYLLDQGITAGLKGELDAALEYFDKVLEADNSFRPARHQKAKVLTRQGKYDEAIAILRIVLDEAPFLPGPRIDLGYACLHDGQLEDADHEFRSALALGEHNIKAKAGLAQIHMFREQWGEAADAARSVLSENGLNVTGLFILGKALRELNDLEGSIAAFDTADQVCSEFVSMRGGQPEGLFWLAEISFEAGKYDESLERFQDCKRCLGGPENYSAFGMVFTKEKVLVRIMQCLAKLKRSVQAREAAQHILQSYPGSKEALELLKSSKSN